MSGVCNILKVDKRKIGLAISAYIRAAENPEKAFDDCLIAQGIWRKTTVESNPDDSQSEKEKLQKDFLAIFNQVVSQAIQINANNQVILEKLRNHVNTTLNILDKSQLGSNNDPNSDLDSEEDLKSSWEVYDYYKNQFEGHCKDIYGLGNLIIISRLQEQFTDSIMAAAYWDSSAGTLPVHNTTILNRSIRNYKARLYNSLLNYMKSKFPGKYDNFKELFSGDEFTESEYSTLLRDFYSYIKSYKDFNREINDDNIRFLKRKDNKDKYDVLYKPLLAELLNIPDFKTTFNNHFTKKTQKDSVLNNLYLGDNLADHYYIIKNWVKKKRLGDLKLDNGKTVNQVLMEIESDPISLLSATSAYTILTHFDELLKVQFGNALSYKKGWKGIETMLDKYDYHQDTDHEKHSWQQGEEISSEKYTSQLTKAVLHTIKIYDMDTGRFTNSRVNSTSFIIAARNLIDDIIYGRIGFNKQGTKNHIQAVDRLLNIITTFHDDPLLKTQEMLELLFGDVEANGNKNLWQDSTNLGSLRQRLTTTNDINILYSVYRTIFSTSNPNSLYSLENSTDNNSRSRSQSIMGEISGYIDRNSCVHYLDIEYTMDGERVNLKVKRKYSSDQTRSRTIKTINNYIHNSTIEAKTNLLNTYAFEIKPGKDIKYSVKIGEVEFEVTTGVGGLFLNSGVKISSNGKIIRDICKNVDLLTFRNKIIAKDTQLTGEEKILKNILQFLDDYLQLGFLTNPDKNLQQLQVYKNIYNENTDLEVYGSTFLEPLITLAMRAAYANYQEVEANKAGQTLKEYLKDDLFYKKYLENKNTNRNFTMKWEDLRHAIASYNDGVLQLWSDANAILTGQASKATTKDKQGHSLPNNSVNKAGNLLKYYLKKANVDSSLNLLFTKYPALIQNIYHEQEATNKQGISKSVSSMSSGELIYNCLINKFFGQYLANGSVTILPTTYSDKTTFLNWLISTKLNIDGNEVDLMNLNSKQLKETVINLTQNTLGNAYREIYNRSQKRLQAIIEYHHLPHKSIKEFLGSVTQKLLIKLADAAGVTLEMDTDYRADKNNKGTCRVNEILEYYATSLYLDKNELNRFLENQKTIMINNMLSSNVFFQVIDYNDNISYYLEGGNIDDGKSKNIIMTIIKSFFEKDAEGRKEFFKNWVDAKSGRLILAKLNENNIVGVNSNFNNKENVELNPLLEKFFYIEGLMSNNLRMSLTGSEINHPDKAKDTAFSVLKNFKSLQEIAEKEKDLKEAYHKYTKQVDNINKILKKNYTGDSLLSARDALKKYKYVSNIDLNNLDENLSNTVKQIISDVKYSTLVSIINTAQGTQFKRNVIIPATLQYCRQNAFEGITPKTKVAVIYDEQAPVWNYRGDHEKTIDSSDGNARINPFQSILENMALDSQAVGFTKKPIWHSYDTENCTAFLAKFATTTITNEEMRSSIDAHTSLHNLFKKMTNLRWGKEVDLTQIIGGNETTLNIQEFNTLMLGNDIVDGEWVGNNRLFYLGKNFIKNPKTRKCRGIVEIKNFNKTLSSKVGALYYTEEQADTEVIPRKVYHVFYDVRDEHNNIIEKSKYISFDTYQQAEEFILNNPDAHTISSLYELHTALGGVYCCDKDGNGSEFNNLVVVNFMNHVGTRKIKSYRVVETDGVTTSETTFETREKAEEYLANHPNGRIKYNYYPIDKSLANYNQPLKDFHIGYALNNTAVKNGAKNINLKEAWYNNEDLYYFEVNSDGLGMQMNADHDIINSELTEFSQVIAATSAYGYTHDKCNEIFQGLAKTALQASDSLIRGVDEFLKDFEDPEEKTNALNKLYDAVGRLILVNESIKDKESLKSMIMTAISDIFATHTKHNEDTYKIPFSDPSLYSEFISTLASTITKQSIKRKHPGSGCVIVPGYNVMLYYEVDGKKYFADDLVSEAKKDYKELLVNELKNKASLDGKINPENGALIIGDDEIFPNDYGVYDLEGYAKKLEIDLKTLPYYTESQDIASINKHFIQTYLLQKQIAANAIAMDTAEWFMPSDVVDILDPEGNRVETVQLTDLDTYYKFKDGIYQAQHAHKVKIDVKYTEGKYTIALEEATDLMFVIEAEKDEDGNYTGKYNIHFKTGGYDEATGRRTVGDLTTEQKQRLFKATLQVLPVGAILRLSPTTKEQLDSGIGGLTSGSIAGYKSIIAEDSKRTEGTVMTAIGEPYVVEYFNAQGEKFSTEVTEYKKVGQTQSYKFAQNVTAPRNLKPSLIRWKYIGEDGKEHYQNVFDSSVVRKAYTEGYNKDPLYRKKIQDLLHSIESGYDPDHNTDIIEGSLENTAAELVMSDIYQEKFGTEGYSLSEVLAQGEDFFRGKKKALNAPVYNGYDIAFLSDQGQHTLISLKPVVPSERVYAIKFDTNRLHTDDNGSIYLMKGNEKLFKVGTWSPVKNMRYEDGKFLDAEGKEILNQEDYRLADKNDPTSIQKKFIYVKPFEVIDNVTKNGKIISYKTNTLYEIANLEVFKDALENLPEREGQSITISASRQRASIINNMYGNHNCVYINTKSYSNSEFNNIKSALNRIRDNYYIDDNVKELLNTLLDYIQINSVESLQKIDKSLSKEEKEEIVKANIASLKESRAKSAQDWDNAIQDFLKKEAHKKWISFQDSLNFIASRIPAQTLQSFMSMKLVGWTKNTKNMAYVSHFQTYLQGSDYDIDKAYIMGESFSDSSTYIGWSSLFDYSTYETLQASKALPIPAGYSEVTVDPTENDSNINEFFTLTNNTGLLEQVFPEKKAKAIIILGNIIRKFNKNKVLLFNGDTDSELFKNLVNLIIKHNTTKLNPQMSEFAYKNVASANIYAVAHDIRNRDLAYTAIAMDIMQDAASKSPKGNQAGELDMLNPLTKYLMQYQNLVGKNVISIAANGEKVWFNTYYHWHQVLLNGSKEDIDRLKFSLTFTRIKGRAKGVPESKTTKAFPDLNVRDLKIKDILINQIGVDESDTEYIYVDLLISQLLSAATDNAKELILAKINAGVNFARMYVYAIMSGYSMDDIVAFMTSPVAEFIDGQANPNMFIDILINNNATSAISEAQGIVGTRRFLHGKITVNGMNREGEMDSRSIAKTSFLNERLLDFYTKEKLSFTEEDKPKLVETMLKLISYALDNSDVDLISFYEKIPNLNNQEIYNYLSYCLNIIDKLRIVRSKYASREDFEADIAEFDKLYQLSSEISTVASAWLGLNQGLPTSKFDIIKRLVSLTKTVFSREKALGIIVNDYKVDDPEDTEDIEEKNKKINKNIDLVLATLLANNPTLDSETIRERLTTAYKRDLVGNFDVIKYLKNEALNDGTKYRDAMVDYYGLLMGSINVFDMMNTIPHYKSILECFKSLIVSEGLSSKSRFINNIVGTDSNITDLQLRSVIRYAEKVMTLEFLQTLPFITPNNGNMVKGFNSDFSDGDVEYFDLGTLEGIAGFRQWVETVFLEKLRKKYDGNPLVKHLKVTVDGDSQILATDIDLLNPKENIISEVSYGDILKGMALFENEKFDDNYTIADILQLYNIVVNNNAPGSDRLTTAFKSCVNENNMLHKYLKYIGERDFAIEEELPYDHIDFLINTAPVVSEYQSQFQTATFIKVKDPVFGYKLKISKNGDYTDYDMVPLALKEEDSDAKMHRILNFATKCPYEFVHSHSMNILTEVVASNEDTPEVRESIRTIIKNYIVSGKVLIFKEC